MSDRNDPVLDEPSGGVTISYPVVLCRGTRPAGCWFCVDRTEKLEARIALRHFCFTVTYSFSDLAEKLESRETLVASSFAAICAAAAASAAAICATAAAASAATICSPASRSLVSASRTIRASSSRSLCCVFSHRALVCFLKISSFSTCARLRAKPTRQFSSCRAAAVPDLASTRVSTRSASDVIFRPSRARATALTLSWF
mmetsp:Transcript_14666/g.48549  ORF Transcript_14666/g.48549 Transcript_14666/m.48549 type:complete len:201 (+) Transcript_14666:296-898(+)